MLLVLTFAACASTDTTPERPSLRSADVAWHELWPELAAGPVVGDAGFKSKRPDAEHMVQLKAAERAWRERDLEAYTVARDAIVTDPVASLWLTRMLIGRMTFWLDRGEAGESSLVGEPEWRREQAGLIDLGAAAAPTLIVDLLRERQADRSELGVETLAAIGPAALPALERVLEVPDDRMRRYAVRTLAAFETPDPDVRAALLSATRDADFGVRAAAWTGFVHGPEDAGALRDAIASEGDDFVLREQVRTLGAHRDLESARAILSVYERGLAAKNGPLVEAAREAMRRASGDVSLASLTDCKRWVDSLTTAGGGD